MLGCIFDRLECCHVKEELFVLYYSGFKDLANLLFNLLEKCWRLILQSSSCLHFQAKLVLARTILSCLTGRIDHSLCSLLSSLGRNTRQQRCQKYCCYYDMI